MFLLFPDLPGTWYHGDRYMGVKSTGIEEAKIKMITHHISVIIACQIHKHGPLFEARFLLLFRRQGRCWLVISGGFRFLVLPFDSFGFEFFDLLFFGLGF